MNIRKLESGDAEACFRLRSNAFIQKFHPELSLKEIAAAINAYMPADYIQISQVTQFFVVEEEGDIIGFFNLKQTDDRTAELPLIYIDLDFLGKGIGSACIKYIDKWLPANWPEVERLVVDTIIPKYNSKFYMKAGFNPIGEAFCEYGGLKIKAMRLEKRMGG